jgi:hypothetical protein
VITWCLAPRPKRLASVVSFIGIVASCIIAFMGCTLSPVERGTVVALPPLESVRSIIIGEEAERTLEDHLGQVTGVVKYVSVNLRVTEPKTVRGLLRKLMPVDQDGPATGTFSGGYPTQVLLDGDANVVADVFVAFDGSIFVGKHFGTAGGEIRLQEGGVLHASGRNYSYSSAIGALLASDKERAGDWGQPESAD